MSNAEYPGAKHRGPGSKLGRALSGNRSTLTRHLSVERPVWEVAESPVECSTPQNLLSIVEGLGVIGNQVSLY